ncbi:MAG TPA: S8 family serine peptidase [Gaiellaceae bacterium]|nr:S8 family serine peptidase [Gaiellaceae bacterium]
MSKLMRAALAMASVCAIAVAFSAGASASGQDSTLYSVAFNNPNGLPANVDQIVAKAGGTIMTRIPEIGGIGVQSSNPNFVSAIQADNSVKAAGVAVATSIPESNGLTADSGSDNNGGTYSPTGPDTQAMPDPLGYEQWDKKKMDATTTGSYAVQQGRKDVRVFVVDTGVDQTHPDIAPNLDVADSRSFVPSEPTIQDFNGHGTWTASAVAAPINGIGISGVAPNVTLVEGKVLSGAGSGEFLWLDEAMVYAGLMHFDVVSASLGGYIPKCGSQANPNGCDHPDYILLNRATQFARSNGVLPVGALGNDGFDLAAGSVFKDYVEAPGTMPGWVGVSATGYNDGKAFYSNYGDGAVDVSAPGGSTRDYSGVPGGATCDGHGGLCRLIGAWSSTGNQAEVSNPFEDCTGYTGTPPCPEYGYVQGTSMATPNAAGVAALIISQYGDFTPNNQNKPHMSPTAVEQVLEDSANNQPCPTPNTVTQGPGFAFPTATCTGGTGFNNFFGKGIVDALNAVTYFNNK